MPKNIFDILVVGSGLSSMIFAEEYLKKNRKINLISPDFKKKNKDNLLNKINYKSLPPQLKKNFDKIEDYFDYNQLFFISLLVFPDMLHNIIAKLNRCYFIAMNPTKN